MTEKHYVACTIMAKDEEGRYAFLVKQEGEEFSLPVTNIKDNKTGLARTINGLKDVLTFDVSKLELSELTNAVVKEERIPLFVFTFPNEKDDLDSFLKTDTFSWQYSETLYRTLEDWHFTGVPQF